MDELFYLSTFVPMFVWFIGPINDLSKRVFVRSDCFADDIHRFRHSSVPFKDATELEECQETWETTKFFGFPHLVAVIVRFYD